MDIQENKAIYRTREEWEARVHRSGINKEITYDRIGELLSSHNACAVVCCNGTFVGLRSFNDQTDDVFSWKGIPYAHPPIGERRFKKAELPYDIPKKKPYPLYEAFYYGKSSLQPVDATEASSLYMQGEDCLTLAIYRSGFPFKDQDKESHPVLVYFHGGGWSYGSTSEPIYDGTTFVHNNPDIIVVCVTYRLGLMGQINLSKYNTKKDYQYSTNNGLLDQRCALQWIHDNISGFGGDPNNVTICGESAGGGSVSLQCLIGKKALDDKGNPTEVELFHNAIAMSGGINQVTTWEDSKMLTQRLMEDCKYDSLQKLLDAPFEELAAWWQNNHILMNYPILDGKVLPDNVVSLYAKFSSPEIKEIPMIQGATTNEFAYYRSAFTDEQFNTICNKVLEFIKDKEGEDFSKYSTAVLDLYKKMHPDTPLSDEEIVKLELTNDYALQGINYRQLGLIGNTGRTYAYAFDIPYEGDKGLYSLYSKIEAAHGVDCFYLFGNFDGRKCHGSRDAVNFSKNFQRYIADFCKYGKLGDNDIWQPYVVDEKDKKDKKDENNENNILLLTQDKDEYHFLRTNDFAARITTYNKLVEVNADLLNLKPWSFFLTENHR